ncbi:MAG: hypothetical protein COX57_12000 [Alphaproteobacteria bacterium CG_4_10_14_0_2_um_filter_63_37]|nr:MAG: hypothetical protein AUJ55_09485 [Proteobacteria bacterium CG1_02_64_396]PJA23700.1 MAG: hypothetical protein COX57_12000 [Alphaproteobacteria bacterium CG_4_10_14_0_2_um_filter_63_37]
MFAIRPEEPQDLHAIRFLHRLAFSPKQADEAGQSLTSTCANRVSLVAFEGEKLVGHILFNPVWFETEHGVTGGMHGIIGGMGVRFMAIHPDRQSQRVGGCLLEQSLQTIAQLGCHFVVALEPTAQDFCQYGFKPANLRGLTCTWNRNIQGPYTMVTLNEKTMGGMQRATRYRGPLDLVG